jgi:hypothetical protein
MPVYHVLNTHQSPRWQEMLRWLSEEDYGPDFEVVQPSFWVGRLEETLGSSAAGHPSQALLDSGRRPWTVRTLDNPAGPARNSKGDSPLRRVDRQ